MNSEARRRFVGWNRIIVWLCGLISTPAAIIAFFWIAEQAEIKPALVLTVPIFLLGVTAMTMVSWLHNENISYAMRLCFWGMASFNAVQVVIVMHWLSILITTLIFNSPIALDLLIIVFLLSASLCISALLYGMLCNGPKREPSKNIAQA